MSEPEYPLETSWTLWYDGANKGVGIGNWDIFLNEIATCDSIFSFWNIIHHIIPPSLLHVGSNYHFFKHGIEPKWEDPVNSNGGKWIISIPEPKSNLLNEYWINTLMFMVGGEALDDEMAQDICGAVISVRKQRHRLALWTRTAQNRDLQERIGRAWKAGIANQELASSLTVEYMVHKDSMAKNSSYSNKIWYGV